MNNLKKKNHGNALTAALGLVVAVALVVFLGALLMHPYRAIDESRNNELQTMVTVVKGSPFESAFKDKINYFLADGKISNKEFIKLQELYSGYKTSTLTGEDQNFSNKTKKELEQQYKIDEKSTLILKVAFLIFGIIAIVVTMLIGWVKVKP